ncbi:MAG TPA: phospholipase D-like domain-containing protein [Spirochaetia bacterium]|nr:phospholipase D-like domain-containing protein [Spirochaetia bacterium]
MSKANSRKSKWILIVIFTVAVLILYSFFDSQGKVEKPPIPSATPTVQGVATQKPSSVPPPIPSTETYYEIYFTDPTNPDDKSVEQALIQKIDASEKSIDLAVFEFDIEAVGQAIIRAKERGVTVRVVYDNEYSDKDKQMGELKSEGIPAVPDNRSALMHNKFFVFDNDCVWTGSFNITNNASRKNNENAVYFCSPEASANYKTEFAEMYSGEFGTTSPSDTPYPTFVINGIAVENCFAPEDKCMAKVIKAVNTAETSIHFLAFSFTYNDLAKTMIANANKGVVVEGIFESRSANTDSSECGRLLNKGYDIRLDGNPGTMHQKVIIIDEKIVIFGSFNFSVSADEKNDENLLIWYDPTLATVFEEQYQLIKSQAVIPSGTNCSK